MKRRTFYVLACAILIWAALFTAAWFTRTDCEGVNPLACAFSAALRFGADVFMFRWVDTTLGAGFLAFGGGAFVYFAAKEQRRHLIEDRQAELKSLRLGHLLQLRRLLATLEHSRQQLVREDGTPKAEATDPRIFDRIGNDLAQTAELLGMISPYATLVAIPLGNLIERAQTSLIYASSAPPPLDAKTALHRDLAVVTDCRDFFEDTERLLETNGTFRFVPVKRMRPLCFDEPILWQFYT